MYVFETYRDKSFLWIPCLEYLTEVDGYPADIYDKIVADLKK